MVMTKSELIGSLKNEVRILLHLASKIDPAKLDYRPTAKQRSTLDLLRYLSMMGPVIVEHAKEGKFDTERWGKAETEAMAQSFDETIARITEQSALYERLLLSISDADMRTTINMFGEDQSRGAFLVNLVLSGCAAYRTQLFVYLKACGREELGTYDLWAGMDAPATA